MNTLFQRVLASRAGDALIVPIVVYGTALACLAWLRRKHGALLLIIALVALSAYLAEQALQAGPAKYFSGE